MIRFNIQTVSVTGGRATLGVHLIRVDDEALVSTMAKVVPDETSSEETDEEQTEE